jgi:multicomponent Na+:H+ antiporter subunit D
VALLVEVSRHGVLALQVGGWPAPYGITLVADLFSAMMVVLAALMGLAVTVFEAADVGARRRDGLFAPLLHVLLLGVCGAFLTGDIFNLYVWFEVMLIASFVLLALGGERGQMEGALKYVTLNLISSAIFLAAVGILYGMARTLNLADLSSRVPLIAQDHPHLVQAVAGLFVVSFGIKAAVFPLYFWLPASYHTPPVPVSAIFAGLLTKVGVYALVRVCTLVFVSESVYRLLLVLAGLTMVAGVLGAVSQFHIRRILGFHIVSQIGYMVMGLGLLASPDEAVRRLGLIAALFYIAHHIIVKTNLFLVGGIARRLRGSEELDSLGGLADAAPWLAVLFLVPAFSLAGIPPLSGFWAKLAVIRAGLQAGEWLPVGAAVFAGLLTLVSMIKIWSEAFWKPEPPAGNRPAPSARPAHLAWLVTPSVLLVALTLLIGLCPSVLYDLARRAAEQLLDPVAYRTAVGLLGGGAP